MMQLRISEAAELLGVSDDTVRRWVDAGRVRADLDDAGRKVIAGSELAAFAVELHAGRRGESSHHRSARNQFRGIVTAIRSDPVMSQVEMQCGPYRVVSLISTEAVNDLALEAGSVAVAQVKATNVTIESSGRGER